MTGHPTSSSTSSPEGQEDLAALPPAMAELVDDFQAVTEPDRLQLLLELSKELPDLPPRYADHLDQMERVHECQSPLFLAVEVVDQSAGDAGLEVRLFFDAPPESPTTRGFAGILHESLDGLSPQAVLDVPDDAP
ncbi:MAG: SufE family protein, partial [Ornithinimicrobium sp.]